MSLAPRPQGHCTINININLSIYLPIYLTICLIYLSIYLFIYPSICHMYRIYYASGQAAQGHVWHRSDWEATDGRVRSTSGLSCKLNAFSKPRLRKMLSSASECCRNSVAPTSSSFDGKNLKREKDVNVGKELKRSNRNIRYLQKSRHNPNSHPHVQTPPSCS